MNTTTDRRFQQQVRGYRLATAEIIYHLPDYPDLLQKFVWQHYDIAPDFPRLRKFLDYWERNIEGRLHSVHLARSEIVSPAEHRAVGGLFSLH
ncbi:Usg family protein [Marivibrio halodurans]|uniref:Usg family protein n=1 Tax=Marivibrio halodurans TaxID=2039722 RepID=A0A8J7S250_9PROT|nr:Usg family protein [Marivibrio halodurans]MBP5858947.1 Usg family protein [Marivibrio halodurans]